MREKNITIRLHPGSGFVVSDGDNHVWGASSKEAIRDWIYRHLPCGGPGGNDWQLTIEDYCDPTCKRVRVEKFHHEYVQ